MDWRRWGPLAAVGIGLLLVSGLFRRYGPRYAAWRQAQRHAREESEAAYFAHAQRACRGGDAKVAYRALADWARSVHASERTVARLFLSQTGLSFGAWRQQARVLEAMARLSGGAQVTQVAFDLGSDSVSAFSAMFRRAAGVSPSTFRT